MLKEIKNFFSRYNLEKPVVLAIDDDTTTLALMGNYFESKNEIFFGVNSAKEGLDFLTKFTPSIILLDMIMPEYDGIWFLEQYKNFEKKAPLVVVSGLIDLEITKKVFSLGAKHFIHKPFDLEKLYNEIQKIYKNSPLRSDDDYYTRSVLSTTSHYLKDFKKDLNHRADAILAKYKM